MPGYAAFLGMRPTNEAIQRLVALATDDDTFAVVGREAYWLRRGGIGTSRFASGFLEKTLGMAATVRGLPTITKIVVKVGRSISRASCQRYVPPARRRRRFRHTPSRVAVRRTGRLDRPT